MRFLTQAVLTFLLNAIWQAALVVAFAVFADWLLRGISAHYRHALWIVTLLVCLTLPLLSASTRQPIALRNAVGAPVASGPVVITRILTPDVEVADANVEASTSTGLVATRRAFSWNSVNLPTRAAFTILGIYLAFLLGKLLLLGRAWRRTQSILRGASDAPLPDHLQVITDRCRRSIGVKRVRILHSREVPVPITLGIANPIIVLPESLLEETDCDLLSSAIGHELVHVARRDYLWNLVFETIYLPLSFHPAAVLVRRRIRQTRELCCDEIVAMKLLNAETYAHSLMKLIGSAPLSPRLISDTTIGLNQSDILEVRIMSLLNSKNRRSRSPRSLLIAAALILTAPCVLGAKLALKLDVYAQEPTPSAQEKEAKQQLEKSLQGLKEQERDLSQKLKSADETQRKEIEARLREVQKNLEDHERAAAEFRYQQQDLDKMRTALELYAKSQTASEEDLKKMREYLAKIEGEYPRDDARLREVRDNLARLESAGQNRKAKLIYRVEPDYTPDAREKQITGTVQLGFTVGHDGSVQSVQVKKSLFPSLDESAVAAVRKWRFEPAMKDGQPASMYMAVEFYFSPDGSGADAYREKEEREKTEYKEKEFRARMNENEAGRRAEREPEEKRNATLAGMAQISMERAIQIATSASPGKVLECSLVGERWSSEAELAKPSLVLYHVVILSNDSPLRTHVLVNAVDGSVFRVSKEKQREEEDTVGYANTRREGEETMSYATNRRSIEGGELNGKASSLPNAEYPAIARAAKASGTVTVDVLVDEAGNVVAAKAVSGHPLLQAAAVKAARQAKFTPTYVSGEPARISGYLTYNFIAQ
jgi:TonB family protein